VRRKECELRAQILKVQQRLAALQSSPTQEPMPQQSAPHPPSQVAVIDLTVEDDQQGAAPRSPPPPEEPLDELAAQMMQMSVGKPARHRELIVLD
jgi:hypothetical protein